MKYKKLNDNIKRLIKQYVYSRISALQGNKSSDIITRR